MSNQPNVLVFDASENMVENMVARLAKRLGTEWVHKKKRIGNALKWFGKTLLSTQVN